MTLLLAPSPARADELTLRDVIELHRSGLGEDLLMAVIEADGGSFSLSFADIQDLKSDGLSERVIAALVRTGLRSTLTDQGVAPVVQVNQAVYAPTLVVLGTPDWRQDHHPAGHSDRRQHAPRPDGEPRQEQTPPATWVTRQEDGQNVTALGEVSSSRPPATWVTPRDPKPR